MKRGTHTIQDAIEIVADIPTVLEDIIPGAHHSDLAVETSAVNRAGLQV